MSKPNFFDFKISIEQDHTSRMTNVYFYAERPGGKIAVIKPVDLIEEVVDEYSPIEPTIQLTHLVANNFLQSLAEALDKNNIKTDKDAKIEGTLEATNHHLQDLRQLLKLKK